MRAISKSQCHKAPKVTRANQSNSLTALGAMLLREAEKHAKDCRLANMLLRCAVKHGTRQVFMVRG